MASTPGVHRTVLLHFGATDQGKASTEAGIMNIAATLIGGPANLIVPVVIITYNLLGSLLTVAINKNAGVQVEFIATTDGDVSIISNIQTLQASGVVIHTWSTPVTYGF